jgi:hypothetical protein
MLGVVRRSGRYRTGARRALLPILMLGPPYAAATVVVGQFLQLLFGRRFGLLSPRQKIGQPKDLKLLFENRRSKRPLLKTMAQTPSGIGSMEASATDVRGIDALVDRTQW